MTNSTVSSFEKLSAAFSAFVIDNGSIQNTIDFLLILKTKKIDPVCISDRTWFDICRNHLGVDQEQMKTLIGPLSLLNFKPLFTFSYF